LKQIDDAVLRHEFCLGAIEIDHLNVFAGRFD